MDRKVMRKLLMGMAIFFSHIFIKKQATDHPHTTLHPSSVLNPFLFSQNLMMFLMNFLFVLKAKVDFARMQKSRRNLDWLFYMFLNTA